MKKYGWFGLFFALAFVCVLFVTAGEAAAVSYPDLPESHWAYEEMDRAAQMHILQGMGNGRMEPNGTLTWGQALTLAARAFAPQEYSALADQDMDWRLVGYNACRTAGILMEPEEEFLPVGEELELLNQPITRQDTVVLLDRAIPEKITERRMEYVWNQDEGWSGSYVELTADGELSDFAEIPETHRDAVSRLFSLRVVNGSEEIDAAGEERLVFAGTSILRRCDGAALFMRSLKKVDRYHSGEYKSVTAHLVDAGSGALLQELTLEAKVGESVYSAADSSLKGSGALRDYTHDYFDVEISTACAEYTLTYRAMTAAEREYRDFSEAVERGEASWEDEWKLNYHAHELGENYFKRNLLFGSTEKRRYNDQKEAKEYQVTVTIPYWTIQNGKKVATSGKISINAAIAQDVVAIFTEIFEDPEQFPMHGIGGYNWRGDNATGEHNCGTAIDINAKENYQVREGRAETGSYWKPGEDPYSIPADGSVVRIFEKYGWSWGGDAWAMDADPTTGYHDYMHFSYMGG